MSARRGTLTGTCPARCGPALEWRRSTSLRCRSSGSAPSGQGPIALDDLAGVLGPTFAPLLGGAAATAAIWFMVFNMFHGTLQPLAGAARTLSQLAEDGLLPRTLGVRLRATDAPLVAIVLTGSLAIGFILMGTPLWLLAAANLTYLIGICLPSIAVWLLRRNEPARSGRIARRAGRSCSEWAPRQSGAARRSSASSSSASRPCSPGWRSPTPAPASTRRGSGPTAAGKARRDSSARCT